MSECPSTHTSTKAQPVFIVWVNNDCGLCKMTIQLSDTIVDVCSNAANILQCYCTTVTLDYTAPWFKKMGTKVQPLYFDTNTDLNKLVHSIKEFTMEQKKKQYKKNITCEIILYNMNDETVSFTSFFLLCSDMMSILSPF